MSNNKKLSFFLALMFFSLNINFAHAVIGEPILPPLRSNEPKGPPPPTAEEICLDEYIKETMVCYQVVLGWDCEKSYSDHSSPGYLQCVTSRGAWGTSCTLSADMNFRFCLLAANPVSR